MKRTLDCLISALLLVFLLPILAMLCICIRVDSPGSPVFIQYRIGKGKARFKIFKLRTMAYRKTSNIEQDKEQVVASGKDPRVTRVGRFLRATSMDELPQLWNILQGDMSFIGPRPIIPEQLKAIPPGYMKRFEVRPGLTGLAQVNGRRSLSWLRQLAYDKDYIENQSSWLDIQIFFKTIKVIFIGNGVYGEEGENWRTYLNNLEGRAPADSDVEHFLQDNNKQGGSLK